MNDPLLNARISRLANRRPGPEWMSLEDRQRAIDQLNDRKLQLHWNMLSQRLSTGIHFYRHPDEDDYTYHAQVRLHFNDLKVLNDKERFSQYLRSKIRDLAAVLIEQMSNDMEAP
jgi:hypothetical protein